MKKKPPISKLFLYKNRFIIGYILLAIFYVGALFIIPAISPNAISEEERESAIKSVKLNQDSIKSGDVIDLPYHAAQKAAIKLFGFSIYTIKLPSIIIAILLGVLLILLLNRWFKNNVALTASILTVLSSTFLYLAGMGTPRIMTVFWPTLLLWLGSKIQGVNRPKPAYCFIFAICLLLSLFTPYMIYAAILILLFAITHPHLRHTIKTLPKLPLIFTCIIILGGVTSLSIGIFTIPGTLSKLIFTTDFGSKQFFNNINAAMLPFFSWSGNVESTLLAPMIGLPVFALAVLGILSTAKGFFASRNAIATLLIIFTIIISGFNPASAVLILLPLTILTAHGIRYVLEKWYGLFPENPYARITGLIPIATFLGIIIVSSISHFMFGYRYNPSVSNLFSNDLAIISEKIEEGTTLLLDKDTTDYKFYKIYANKTDKINVENIAKISPEPGKKYATLGKVQDKSYMEKLKIEKIITSSKLSESDRIYIYTVNQE